MSDLTETPVPGSAGREREPELDTEHAHSARVYNYWLGGRDNYAADRQAAEQAIAANPRIVTDVVANRAFLARAVRYLAADRGVDQFLDIGTGLPTAATLIGTAARAVRAHHQGGDDRLGRCQAVGDFGESLQRSRMLKIHGTHETCISSPSSPTGHYK